MRPSEILGRLGSPIAFYPDVAHAVKGVGPGLLLCQLLYWTGKEQSGDGWIYKRWQEIEAETGLTRHEQRAARRTLVTLGFLEEQYTKTAPRVLMYRVNQDALCTFWCSSEAPSRHSNGAGNHVNGAGNHVYGAGNHAYTKTTTETTSERKKSMAAHAAVRFEDFWSLYPKKDKRKPAIKVWNRLAPDDALVAVILAAVRRQRGSPKWREGFIPNPDGWLRNEQWTDEGTVAPSLKEQFMVGAHG